ncbi:MAG: sigma-54-dependent Fis family transcriptional regulator [Planctomycetota bacterium]|nr:MAG: sigma-54-dependent Fis family transcriptional regulator [Planctomycetota bacterium]
MRRLCDLIRRIAPSSTSVLLIGETGTGKELVARAIHENSPRRDRPFVAINCAAIPEALLESDLFGHARGSFTGASHPRRGLLQAASGGTVFFDEIGDMPLGLQAKVLRAFQERKVRPVGSDEEVPIDVRVLSATHRDLDRETAAGRFREDLLYRLNVIRLDIPPLAARGDDILLVARHYLERFARENGKAILGFSPGAIQKLLAYRWPGNIRELSNCIERAVALSTREVLLEEDLPDAVRSYRPAPEKLASEHAPAEALLTLAELERRYILQVLEVTGGNKARAARILGLDRKTLYRKLNTYRAQDAAAKAPDE